MPYNRGRGTFTMSVVLGTDLYSLPSYIQFLLHLRNEYNIFGCRIITSSVGLMEFAVYQGLTLITSNNVVYGVNPGNVGSYPCTLRDKIGNFISAAFIKSECYV